MVRGAVHSIPRSSTKTRKVKKVCGSDTPLAADLVRTINVRLDNKNCKSISSTLRVALLYM